MFNQHTMKLIQIIKEYYESVYAIKPLTSRPANSEKYLLCIGYKKSVNTQELTDKLIYLVSNYTEDNLNKIFNSIEFKYTVLKNLVLYNYYYSIRQVYYIERTINYINYFSDKKNDNSEMNKIMDDHIRKSKKWCDKYILMTMCVAHLGIQSEW